MTAGGSQAAQELQGTVAGSGQQLSEQDQAAQLALLLELLSTKEVVRYTRVDCCELAPKFGEKTKERLRTSHVLRPASPPCSHKHKHTHTSAQVIGMPPRAPASADDSSTPSTAGGGVSATSATASGSDAASSDSGSGVAAARPIYPVFPGTVSNAVARQLRIHLPKHHVLMPGGPITAYGTYQVPLNLQSADGQRIELRVTVRSRRRL